LYLVISCYGSLNGHRNKIRRRSKAATDDRNTVNILAAVTQNPHASTRQLAHESSISQRSVLQILHFKKFHAFHVSLHQELHGNDFQNCVNFCEWGLQKLQSDELFLTKVLFTDEATFTNCGQVNRHSMYYWSIENPWWLCDLRGNMFGNSLFCVWKQFVSGRIHAIRTNAECSRFEFYYTTR
ncbi:hypothetical protein WN55_06875, partial [Dufourea novaeangliae]